MANGVSSGQTSQVQTKLPSWLSSEHYTSCDVLHLRKIVLTLGSSTQETLLQPSMNSFAKQVRRLLRLKDTTIHASATQERTQRRNATSINVGQTGSRNKEFGFTTTTHTIGRMKSTNASQPRRSTNHTNSTTGVCQYGQRKIRKFTWHTHRRYARRNVRKYLWKGKDWSKNGS